MSGGSLNYLYQRVEEAADKKSFVHDAGFKQNTPLRKAFAKHLLKVAKALHDIEWVDSDDMSVGDENQAIADCMDRKEIEKEVIKEIIGSGQEKYKDVHTEHCCKIHGCKYGDSDCSVAMGTKKQSHPCESCDFVGE
jgi:hypothetical protein